MKNGKFIVIEGPNKAGKTTFIRALVKAYSECGYSVVSTREPGGTPLGEGLRGVLKNPLMRGGSFATALAFNAARKEHAEAVILPDLERGEIVICDRYFPSTEIFQIELGGGMDPEDAALLRLLHRRFPRPDLLAFIIPDPELIKQRSAASDDVDAFEGNARELEAYATYASRISSEPGVQIIRTSIGRECLDHAIKGIMGVEGARGVTAD